MACPHGILIDDQRLSVTRVIICLKRPGYVVSKFALSVVLAPIQDTHAVYTGGQIAEVVDIPATMVGKLIGKAGETIKQLQYSTNTKVRLRSAPIRSPIMEGLIRVLLSVLAMGDVRSS